MIRIDTYRISPGRDRWRRTWQAEWDGCQRAVRAYTERGVYAKALRAARRGLSG